MTNSWNLIEDFGKVDDMKKMKGISSFFIVFLITILTLNTDLKAASIGYDFEDGTHNGISWANCTGLVENGALHLNILPEDQRWRAKLFIDVNDDIYANPQLYLRYKIGNIAAGKLAGTAITLKIDGKYTDESYTGTWRLYPTLDASKSDWQSMEVDLKPVIDSWESKNGPATGNVQQIQIFIGNTNYGYYGDISFDYIRVGDAVKATETMVNPLNLSEILVKINKPVTGTPSDSNYTIQIDGIERTLAHAYLKNDSIIALELASPIDFNILNPAFIEISYNGRDNIKTSSGSALEAFNDEVSWSDYVQDGLWKFWGKYNKTPIEDITQAEWLGNDTIIEGWDWSLPEWNLPSDKSNLCIARNFNVSNTSSIDNLQTVNFASNPVISHWVKWRELEPTENNYNFNTLKNNILLASQKGYKSVVRIHSSATNFAPAWIESYNIPIDWEHSDASGIINYDVSHPEFHSRYKELIDALGQSGIPTMDEVVGLYLGYASKSNGDEGIGDDTELHVIERIDAWAAACKDVEYKVFMGGMSDYGFAKGFGVRRGFVEHYMYHIPDATIGQEVDSKGYLYVNEENPIVKNNLFHGEENEEYDEVWATASRDYRFGKFLSAYPYRYFSSNLRLLQMRCNYVLYNGFSLLPEMLAWVSLEMGKTIEDAPDGWCFLRESYLKEFYLPVSTVKNFERWVYQRDAPGYETTPYLKVQHPIEAWMVKPEMFYDFIARRGKKMGFAVDDNLFPPGEQTMAIKISYYDSIAGTLKLVYRNNAGMQEKVITTLGEDKVKTATFYIDARLDATGMDFDFELHSAEEVPVIFVRVIKTKENYTNNDQQPYQSVKRTIPGIIECEHYDEGDPGFAYKDDEFKEGDVTYRPTDSVDVVFKSGAGNDSIVSFTNEGEWLEYTVDVLKGKYDVTLYYYCGESAGDLLLSLDGLVLDTITGINNTGWDNRDSIIVNGLNITGGNSKILQLKFINGAGFDIDALKFKKLSTPVSDIVISGCPATALKKGELIQLEADIFPADADDISMHWSSTNSNVATVFDNGLVNIKTEGTSTITVTSNDGNLTDECFITVEVPIISVQGVNIDNCPPSVLIVGETYQFTANVSPSNADDQKIYWSSSNPAVASIDSNGFVNPKSQGSATITVTTNDGGFTNTCSIGVYSIPVEGVTISGCPDGNLSIGETIQLSAIISPENATDNLVAWASSDTSVAKIDESGMITPIQAGNATITVTTIDGDYSDECRITVSDNTLNNSQIFDSAERPLVYPNPFSNELTIELISQGKVEVIVYDSIGRVLYASTATGNLIMSTSEWDKGLYFVQFDGKEVIKVYKF